MTTTKNSSNLYTVIACVFVATLLISNIVGQKLIIIGPFVFAGGILLFPISYIFGDVLTEVWGYSKSRLVIYTGFFCSIFMAVMFYLAIQLPSAPRWTHQHEFQTILGFVPRIVAGSMVAYFCGEFLNSFILAKMKILNNGKKMGLRFVVSTLAGESVDTTIFFLISFSGTMPSDVLIRGILTGILFKSAYEIIALPLTIPFTKWLKKVTHTDVFDKETNFNPFIIS